MAGKGWNYSHFGDSVFYIFSLFFQVQLLLITFTFIPSGAWLGLESE